MKISVAYQGKTQSVSLDKNPTVKSLLEKMKLNPDIVLVAKNGEIVLEEESINGKDKIEIIRTISGG